MDISYRGNERKIADIQLIGRNLKITSTKSATVPTLKCHLAVQFNEIFLEIAFLIAVLLVSLQLQSNAISKLKIILDILS